MIRTIHRTSALLLTALGAVHTALTPVFYGRFSLGALWFAGSGLTMVFLGFLNIILERDAGKDRLVRGLCYVANVLTVAFGCLIVVVDSEPQVIFGLVLLILLAATSPLI